MDIEAKKKVLIEWINNLDDETVIKHLLNIRANTSSKDFWFDLTPDVQQELTEATKQLDAGEYLSHEEVMQKVKERFL